MALKIKPQSLEASAKRRTGKNQAFEIEYAFAFLAELISLGVKKLNRKVWKLAQSGAEEQTNLLKLKYAFAFLAELISLVVKKLNRKVWKLAQSGAEEKTKLLN